MLLARMIKRCMEELDGPEPDQPLVSLYQHHRETIHPDTSKDERVRRFQEWLQRLLTEKNEEFETWKIRKFFTKELPSLHQAWEETKKAVMADRRQP